MAGIAIFIIQMVVLAIAAIFSLLSVVPRNRIANEIFTPTSTIAGEGMILPTKKMHVTALAVCSGDALIPNGYRISIYWLVNMQ